MNEEVIQAAVNIIYYAGNARKLVSDGLKCLKQHDYSEAADKFSEAQKEIAQAHNSQTDLISREANDEEIKVTLLMVHAQATLMVAMSEIHMAKSFLDIIENL